MRVSVCKTERGAVETVSGEAYRTLDSLGAGAVGRDGSASVWFGNVAVGASTAASADGGAVAIGGMGAVSGVNVVVGDDSVLLALKLVGIASAGST